MKRIDIAAYGEPEEVARCVEVPQPGPPAAGEVLFDVVAFPINPADLSFCRGRYRLKPPLPATPGAECVGRVMAVGAGVDQVGRGDLVINLKRENWAQQRLVRSEDVIALPPGIDPLQAAMIRINPPTALLLLSDVVDIAAGGFVIQNVANSAVGRLIIHFARTRGLHTVNVVRRDDVFDELKALHADVCLVDGPDLAQEVRAATGGAVVGLGIDAVSGRATARIAACVADGGTVCTYGSMSREDPVVGSGDVVSRGVRLVGFMLGRFLARRSLDQIRALYRDVAAQVVNGSIRVPICRVYPIEDIRAALVYAQTPGHNGKVLVAPNGMI
jgi:mitochondrial enoyl-[acyl-carrier protein] reductase / trans-2-enoyl-CoA reductase